jgi:hypothetical protein
LKSNRSYHAQPTKTKESKTLSLQKQINISAMHTKKQTIEKAHQVLKNTQFYHIPMKEKQHYDSSTVPVVTPIFFNLQG